MPKRDGTDNRQSDKALRELAERELEQCKRDMDRFAALASHDLQEPLRIISGFAQLLERRYKGKLDSDADEFIHYIVDGADRIQHMIKDLLDYSRITTQGKPFMDTDCNRALRKALTHIKASVEESGAEVAADHLPDIWADEQQIILLFQNLIGNAVKFRSAEPPVIHISSAREGAEWKFSVRDNGIGIASQYFERIFQAYQRLHQRDRYPGTGMGLALCKRIVERHGGRIWAESEEGKGSVFYFTVPASPKKTGIK